MTTPYDPVRYAKLLKRWVTRLPPSHRACFGLWCLRRMDARWRNRISHLLPAKDQEFFRKSLELFWNHLFEAAALHPQQLAGIKERASAIAAELELDSGGTYQEDTSRWIRMYLFSSLADAADALATGKALHSVSIGNTMIDCIDAELGDQDISPHIGAPVHKEIALEHDQQEEILRYLNGAKKLMPKQMDPLKRLTG
jgi:hypothetical protein